MWKRQQHSYGQTPVATTPYQKAAQVWDTRIGDARVQARNWRLMALLSLGLACGLAAAFVWRSSSSLITPYVVELESNGDVRAVKSALPNYHPRDAQIAHQLAAFIQNVRSVSIDPIVVRQNWLEAYAYTTDQAALTLNQYARDNDPFANVGKRSVSVDVASVVRASADSFELRWRETVYASGVQQGQSTHTAVLSVVLKPPRDEATLHRNPLGLYVHGINWSKDL
ncbi:MAG: conjugal transfer protein TrbF, partial [Pseudomonadota bacterium]